MDGFKKFILRGNVVDLAVAVVIGKVFGDIITAVQEGFINPLIAAIFGKARLIWNTSLASGKAPRLSIGLPLFRSATPMRRSGSPQPRMFVKPRWPNACWVPTPNKLTGPPSMTPSPQRSGAPSVKSIS